MDTTRNAADEQTKRWNGPAGRAWVDQQPLLDHIFTSVERLLADAVAAHHATRVLDVGCGTGTTTLAAARRLGDRASAVGIDISEVMLAAARERAAHERLRASFICASAQDYAFEPAHFDMVISRFGVMFFSDPIRAFANLRSAAAPGAELRVVTWRSAAENAFMMLAERIAAPFLPNLPPRQPDGPGQFALADPRRVQEILAGAGWSGVDIQPLDAACSLPEADLTRYLTRLGPVGLALQEVDEETRARVVEAVRPHFDAYIHGGQVQFTAACWNVAARQA